MRELPSRILAQQDGASGFELGHCNRRLARNVAGQQTRAGSGRHCGDVIDVLERIGNAVQRAARSGGGDLGLCPQSGVTRSLGSDCHEAAEGAVEGRDPYQICVCQLDWREFPRGDSVCRLCDR